MGIDPKEWIVLKIAHKKDKFGTTIIEFPNDGMPRFVENSPFITIESFLDVRLRQRKIVNHSNNDIEIVLDKASFQRLNDFSSGTQKAELGVFVMDKPFSLIHSVKALEEPIICWSGEDEAGATLVIELIKTYKTINRT